MNYVWYIGVKRNRPQLNDVSRVGVALKRVKKLIITEKHPIIYCGYMLIRSRHIQGKFKPCAFCVAMATT